MPVDQRRPPRACPGVVVIATGQPNGLIAGLARALTEEREPLRLVPAWHQSVSAQLRVHPALQLRRRLDRCSRLDHGSRRMAAPWIRAPGRRCDQTPLEPLAHRTERGQRPCNMDAVAAIHTDKVAADGNPIPVDAHAEQPRTRPLTANHRQLPHWSSHGLETSAPTTTVEVGRTAAPTHCPRGWTSLRSRIPGLRTIQSPHRSFETRHPQPYTQTRLAEPPCRGPWRAGCRPFFTSPGRQGETTLQPAQPRLDQTLLRPRLRFGARGGS